MKKAWKYFVNFWKGIWAIIKSMGNWRGVLSLFIVWASLSGAGLIAIGFIFSSKALRNIGFGIYAFWLGPFTPLIPIMIALAMFIQRFIFLDKNVSWKTIKDKFKMAFSEDENEKEHKEIVVIENEDIKPEELK